MKHLLNTLFVTTQGAYLSQEGEAIQVRHEGELKLRVPVRSLQGIVCLGNVAMSPQLMEMCSEHQVGISFLTENGHFLARVHGPVSGNVLLRREQYRWADDEEKSARLARSFVIGKIANCRTVLMRAARDREQDEVASALTGAAHQLARVLRSLKGPLPVDTVRGREGEAGNVYFGAFDHLITAEKEAFSFHGRSRRPPLDNVNALLSFVYTLLSHDVEGALEGVGLDPAVGYLHTDRPGRPSLALDLMEELRPFLGDRLVLSLINREQVRGNGFERTESGGVLMNADTRKTVLVAYQERKREEITHPFINEKIEVGLLPFIQARLLARHIRGDIDAYPPFFWR
jgi:CRISP-associated protein Cas1